MLNRRVSLGLAVAAAALALGSAGSVSASPSVSAGQKAVMAASGRRFEVRRDNLWGGTGLGARYGRRAAYGWTNAHQKRVSAKKRNQARHRRACRG